MDWSSWISTAAAVASLLGGAFAYYQAHFSKEAKAEAMRERGYAEQAEKRAVEAADNAKLRLEAMDEQTAVFREQALQLESIAKAVNSGSLLLEGVNPGAQHPYIEKKGTSNFAIINPTDLSLSIESIRNRGDFVRIDLDNNFIIKPYAQKTFIALGALQKPLPENLILDVVGQDKPLHLALPSN